MQLIHGIHRNLPAKAQTESKRRKDRDAAKEKAKEFLRSGRTEEAKKEFTKAVDITHAHAVELMRQCRKVGVDCITAMYEADSQLAFLNKSGLADYIISEDSDLILFGCSQIIFKLQLDGRCLLFDADKLYLSMNTTPDKFSFEKFRRMCILSGCDYLDNLPGIGLSKARKFMTMTEEDDMKRALRKIPSYLNMKKLTVTDEYIDAFQKAEATFKFMFVYDPIKREMLRLNPIDEFDPELAHCTNAGELVDHGTAFQLALGNINPRSFVKMDDFDPDCETTVNKQKHFEKRQSIWKIDANSSKVTAKTYRHQTNIGSFFSNPPRKENTLTEVQNIMEQENDVICEMEIDDLVSSYCVTEVSTAKRRTSDYQENDDKAVLQNVSITKNPFAKRHQTAIAPSGKPSLLDSLTSDDSMKQNLRVLSRFFVKKNVPEPPSLCAERPIDEMSLKVVNASKDQRVQHKEFYATYETNEPSSSQQSDNSAECSQNSIETPEEEPSQPEKKTDVVDLDNYTFKVKSQKQTFINNSKPQTTSNPVKPKGSSWTKAKSFTKKSAADSSAQTKLSKFGFQKKATLNA